LVVCFFSRVPGFFSYGTLVRRIEVVRLVLAALLACCAIVAGYRWLAAAIDDAIDGCGPI
jgi:hypothetical protein